ncbi:hypothetical protein HK097_004331 [Rhizophlyctis rosea]|uniref:Uncharacterized protein n=1 Tax=Rhizophlyctis rosea TaxID=64517 RepID=A0AAD5SK34_9FUNG|nr:hypothetical protein HK097_004331 [Rhizophlyctis rosea]
MQESAKSKSNSEGTKPNGNVKNVKKNVSKEETDQENSFTTQDTGVTLQRTERPPSEPAAQNQTPGKKFSFTFSNTKTSDVYSKIQLPRDRTKRINAPTAFSGKLGRNLGIGQVAHQLALNASHFGKWNETTARVLIEPLITSAAKACNNLYKSGTGLQLVYAVEHEVEREIAKLEVDGQPEEPFILKGPLDYALYWAGIPEQRHLPRGKIREKVPIRPSDCYPIYCVIEAKQTLKTRGELRASEAQLILQLIVCVRDMNEFVDKHHREGHTRWSRVRGILTESVCWYFYIMNEYYELYLVQCKQLQQDNLASLLELFEYLVYFLSFDFNAACDREHSADVLTKAKMEYKKRRLPVE